MQSSKVIDFLCYWWGCYGTKMRMILRAWLAPLHCLWGLSGEKLWAISSVYDLLHPPMTMEGEGNFLRCAGHAPAARAHRCCLCDAAPCNDDRTCLICLSTNLETLYGVDSINHHSDYNTPLHTTEILTKSPNWLKQWSKAWSVSEVSPTLNFLFKRRTGFSAWEEIVTNQKTSWRDRG